MVEHGVVVKDTLLVLGGDAASGVIDGEQQTVALAGQTDFDIFESIGDEVTHNASQRLVVGGPYHVGGDILLVADAATLRHLGEGAGIVAHNSRHIHTAPADDMMPRGHTAQVDNLLDQTVQTPYILHHRTKPSALVYDRMRSQGP